jgi:hypothetical protein
MKHNLDPLVRKRLADLISRAAMLGRTHNDFDLQRAAQAVVSLEAEFGVRIPSLDRAKEILASFK